MLANNITTPYSNHSIGLGRLLKIGILLIYLGGKTSIAG